MLRVHAYIPAADVRSAPYDTIVLEADERRLRRKVLRLMGGDEILIDFPAAITLSHKDALELEDGRLVGIIAADEPLYEIRGRDRTHLVRLAWHLGNRHLPAQLEEARILIRRDHVIADMLKGLGATVVEIEAPFSPEHGAYHDHSHGSAQGHALLYRK
ncbi:Urease accessory protein UreE [Devosia sp. DBB001]|nr:Urease accessory protein UreE [Devosia sp. DBB001]